MKKYTIKTSKQQDLSIDYAEHLNPEQYAAVTAGAGPSLVIAGAGSGKTRVVTYRVAYLIENGARPSEIMLLTFTNKAAKEMLHRIEPLIKGGTRKVAGGTFHSIGNMILRKYGEAVGIAPGFTILDREDSKSLMESCIADMKLRKDKMFPKANVILNIISYAVGIEQSMTYVIDEKHPHLAEYSEEIENLKKLYDHKKRQMLHMDFEDLLFFWKELLVRSPEIRQNLSQQYKNILVDEYQDTNKIQAEIIDLMASSHKNLMVVGDDSQAIYSFRGACFDNIIEFPERYPETTVFKLTTNYRSTEEILNLANESISYNSRQFSKTLNALGRSGARPALVPLKNGYQQAEFVSQRILEMIDEGIPMREIAVLYRSHFQSMDLQMELTRKRIPYEIRSGLRFFEQAHIKDIISFLRSVLNPQDEISWGRILKLTPGIGGVSAKKIWEKLRTSDRPAETAGSDEFINNIPKRGRDSWESFRSIINTLTDSIMEIPAEAIRAILISGYENHLKGTYENYEDRKEDIEQLANYAAGFNSAEEFLSDLALLSSLQSEDIDEPEDHEDSIVLSTIHRAKGLEWSRVFLIGLFDGGMPSARAMEDLDQEEEERRVFYVALTRAKDELYLCYPVMDNRWYDGAVIKRPSIFIQELDNKSYEQWEVDEY